LGEGDDAERFLIDRTTCIYVPAGLVHAPMNFLRIDKPVLNVAIGLNSGDYQ
jgi:mannose-6-phosphate isomerase-like protein (cupin superfamily)